jgi:hypothetical protein
LAVAVGLLFFLATIPTMGIFWNDFEGRWHRLASRYPLFAARHVQSEGSHLHALQRLLDDQFQAQHRQAPWISRCMRPGGRVAPSDSLQRLRSLLESAWLWGGDADSILPAQERSVLSGKPRDSLIRAEAAARCAIAPTHVDLALAGVLERLQRLRPPFDSLSDDHALRLVLEVQELREACLPGSLERYRATRRERLAHEARQQILALRALHGLALSLSVPEAEWPVALSRIRADFSAGLRFLQPLDPDWEPLLRERLRYAKDSDPRPSPAARCLEADSACRQALEQELSRLGYPKEASDPSIDSLAAPLARFQANHGREPTGRLDDSTLRLLELPDTLRSRQILSALRTLRSAPWSREPYYVKVNVPKFMLEVIHDGEVVRRHRVVVGRDTVGRFTPTLSSKIRWLVLNPEWHVPPRILRDEILSGRAMDAQTLRENGYEPKYDVDGNIKGAYQPSGDDNALGKVKIVFDNRFGVYLHDTPSRYLFERRKRAYSHGCVRVENPLILADELLRHDGSRFAGKLDSLVDEEDQKWLGLRHPVPLFIEYRTVTTDGQGRARFLRDWYGEARAAAKAKNEAERQRRLDSLRTLRRKT